MDSRWLVVGGVVAFAVFLILRKDAIALAGAAVDGAKTIGNAVNPVNHENIFSQAANGLGGAIAGDANWSLGDWIGDLTHPAPSNSTPLVPRQ